MEYSQIILNFIEYKGVTLYRLAKETGISESLFSKWKKKPTSDVSIRNAKKIADYFNVTLDYLIEEQKQPAKLKLIAKGGETAEIAVEDTDAVQKLLEKQYPELL